MNSTLQLAYIICGVIGAAFLVLALILIAASLSSREKKQKVVEVQQDNGGFFAANEESAKLRAGARTNAREATQYADLADLPGESSSQGIQELNRPLSHTELLGQLGDEEEERN